MTQNPWKMALFRPAAVSIHDDCNMSGPGRHSSSFVPEME
jgi:hypothetical protein